MLHLYLVELIKQREIFEPSETPSLIQRRRKSLDAFYKVEFLPFCRRNQQLCLGHFPAPANSLILYVSDFTLNKQNRENLFKSPFPFPLYAN